MLIPGLIPGLGIYLGYYFPEPGNSELELGLIEIHGRLLEPTVICKIIDLSPFLRMFRGIRVLN